MERIKLTKAIITGIIAGIVATAWLSDTPTKAANDHLPAAQPFAHSLYLQQGADAYQWKCLVTLWTMESHWNYKSVNKVSGSRGIPQALPAIKMKQMGNDYKRNYQTQIRWGLLYIKLHWHNSACNALKHEKRMGWY